MGFQNFVVGTNQNKVDVWWGQKTLNRCMYNCNVISLSSLGYWTLRRRGNLSDTEGKIEHGASVNYSYTIHNETCSWTEEGIQRLSCDVHSLVVKLGGGKLLTVML
jgi:hypothetical protein